MVTSPNAFHKAVREFGTICLTAGGFVLPVLVLQRGEEKGLGVSPVPVGSRPAQPERLRRLLVAQAAEVAELDQLRLDRGLARQGLQRAVDVEDLVGPGIDDIEGLLQVEAHATAA